MRGQGTLLQHSIVGVILHAGHEPHSLLRQLPEPFVIGVAAIEHQHRLRLKPHLACHPDLMHLSLRDHRIRRQIALMIEQQMQLDRALGLFEPGPIENFGAQIDHCRVQTYQLVLEAKFPLLALRQRLAFAEQLMEYGLVQLPGALFVGIGQC